MTGDVVDERFHEISEKMGHSTAGGFGKKQYLEAIADLSDEMERVTFEVMEKKIRDQDSAGRWRCGEEVALFPFDVRWKVGRRRCEIVGGDGGCGKFPGEMTSERAVSRADFRDAFCCCSWEFPGCMKEPAIVSHQEIDHPEVPAAANGGRVIVGEMIENFRNDDSCGHEGKFLKGSGRILIGSDRNV